MHYWEACTHDTEGFCAPCILPANATFNPGAPAGKTLD
jgi:hypothetical protein